MGDRSSVVDKVTAMKKAGFSPWMILLITLASSPGLWQQFVDDTDEKALNAIEKAYPLLVKDAKDNTEARKRQAEINQKILVEITRLQTQMGMILGGRNAYALEGPVEDDVVRDVMGSLRGFGGGGVGLDGGGAALLPPEELFPAVCDEDTDADEEGAEGSSEGSVEGGSATSTFRTRTSTSGKAVDSLEDLIQQQAPIREKLPDLGELLGKK